MTSFHVLLKLYSHWAFIIIFEFHLMHLLLNMSLFNDSIYIIAFLEFIKRDQMAYVFYISPV